MSFRIGILFEFSCVYCRGSFNNYVDIICSFWPPTYLCEDIFHTEPPQTFFTVLARLPKPVKKRFFILWICPKSPLNQCKLIRIKFRFSLIRRMAQEQKCLKVWEILKIWEKKMSKFTSLLNLWPCDSWPGTLVPMEK